MKIVFDQQIFGAQVYGGISRYFYELAECLVSEHKQNVEVVTPFYVNEYLKNGKRSFKLLGMNIRQYRGAGNIIRIINWIITFLILKYSKPDIVHETYYSARSIAPKKARVIITVYDMINERLALPGNNLSHEKIIAIARADHIICISENTRKELIELFGVRPDKVSVIYLGFGLIKNSIKFQADKKIRRPFLLYVGLRCGYKNFKGLIEAYSMSAKLKNDFNLICFGGGDFTNLELNLFNELGLSQHTIIQVSGNDASLAWYYQSAAAFIYPSIYEGFGIPPLEAMSFSCPVICSNVSSIPEVVGNAAIMFNPNDPNSIRSAIELVVGDKELRDMLISRGKEQIKKYSWERCARETLEIYHKVLL